GAPPPLADAAVCKRWRACRPAWPQALLLPRGAPPFIDSAGAPPPALLLVAFASRNGSRLPLADAAVCKRWRACRPAWPQALLLPRGAPPFIDSAGAPPPALLLVAFASRNGSRLPLADAAVCKRPKGGRHVGALQADTAHEGLMGTRKCPGP